MMNNIDELILSGALEVYGVDSETGEFMYSFTEKLEQVAPQVYATVQNKVAQSVRSLCDKGFLYMDPTLEDPEVTVTYKSSDPEEILSLSKEETSVLKSILANLKDS